MASPAKMAKQTAPKIQFEVLYVTPLGQYQRNPRSLCIVNHGEGPVTELQLAVILLLTPPAQNEIKAGKKYRSKESGNYQSF